MIRAQIGHRLLLAVCAVLPVAAGTAEANLPVGKPVPAATGKFLDGSKFDVADYKGNKVVLLDFWGMFCPPCKAAMPELEKLYDRYKSKGLEVIGVGLDVDDAAAFRKFLDKDLKTSITYKIIGKPDGEKIASTFKVGPIPTQYLIDKSGTIVWANSGYSVGLERTIEKEIQRALK